MSWRKKAAEMYKNKKEVRFIYELRIHRMLFDARLADVIESSRG